MNKCCICGTEISGRGNNPQPVKDYGRCCDACNVSVVLATRLKVVE
jgi:hypothetical protein